MTNGLPLLHRRLGSIIAALIGCAWTLPASADAVTDWNEYTIAATKGWNGVTGGEVTLDSNLGARVDAIEARAVFDAVNSIHHFSSGRYDYAGTNSGSAEAAVALAAHDVLIGQLPNPASDASIDTRWNAVRAWVDTQLADYLTYLGVSASDGGIAAGQAAATAVNAARSFDNGKPVTSYGAQLTPTTNPGVGLWRQSNAAAPFVNPATGAPTGFDSTGAVIQGRPGVDLNWKDVLPFALTTPQKVLLVSTVPLSPAVGSSEYARELDFVKNIGRDTAPASARSADQTAQALYYKQDAEIFVNEAARIASKARQTSLDADAKLFALLDGAVADARIASYASKYDQKFWRPITAINADADGGVTNGYAAWHPVAATPSHPSNTAGHSTTGAAGFEILRAFFGSDRIVPNGAAVTLGSLPYLAGTNSGTGNATTRSVTTFSQVQLENGASRIYLGVHFGFDNVQGQLLGLAIADSILKFSKDPAAAGVSIKDSPASLANITRTLLARTDLYGFFGKDTGDPLVTK